MTMDAKACSTPGCEKTVYGPGSLCGKCLEGILPESRGPVTNTELMRARLLGSLDEGVTRQRLIQHGQLRALAPEISKAVDEALIQGRRPLRPAPKRVSVFVSYASEQRAAVLQIEQCLREHGHETWIDVYRLSTLEHLDQTIFSALRTSAYLVACLSLACKDASRYVYRELTAALERTTSEKYLYLLPVVIPRWPGQTAPLVATQTAPGRTGGLCSDGG